MATAGTNICTLQSFCIVTGASKGFGKQLAIRLAGILPDNSALVLLARNGSQLEDTKEKIQEVAPKMLVATRAVDLSCQKERDLDDMLNKILKELDRKPADFKQAIIVHNAASLGDVSKKASELGEHKSLQNYFDLNLTSCILLNTIFFKHFTEAAVKHRVIVAITSICSLQPFKTWSLYCAGKSFRDMFFRTMAFEDPSLRILNYAPGPIDTDMQLEARTVTGDHDLKELFADMHENGTLLTPDESINKLIKIMEENKFESGSHIDYYDV